MKTKAVGLTAGILLATLACGIVGTPAPVQPGVVETVVAETMQALTAVAPPPTEIAQPSGLPVSFQNVSLVIPDGLATGANTEVVPAAGENEGGPWGVAPAYSKFTLVGYPLQGKFFEPHILVYPAQEFESVNSGAAISLEKLRAIIANPSAPITADTIPGVPTFNAAMLFAPNMQALNSQNGTGVRALTEYAQDHAPLNNHGMVYQFQGLTNDGKYYIIAILPVNAAFLAPDENPTSALPADGIPFPDYSTASGAEFTAYYQAVTDKLNATPPDAFTPTITALDALIQSITITSQ